MISTVQLPIKNQLEWENTGIWGYEEREIQTDYLLLNNINTVEITQYYSLHLDAHNEKLNTW